MKKYMETRDEVLAELDGWAPPKKIWAIAIWWWIWGIILGLLICW